MPIITIKMLEGRSKELQKELVANVTDAVVNTLGCSRERTTIVIEEMQNHHVAFGGVCIYDEDK